MTAAEFVAEGLSPATAAEFIEDRESARLQDQAGAERLLLAEALEQRDGVAGPFEQQRGRQPGGSAPDDRDRKAATHAAGSLSGHIASVLRLIAAMPVRETSVRPTTVGA